MARSLRSRRLLLIAFAATVAGVVAVSATRATAATDNGTAVLNGIRAFANQAKQLATQGPLADALAFTGVDPGGADALDLDRVFDDVLGGLPADFADIDPATAPAAAAAALEDLDAPGSAAGDLTVSVGCPDSGPCDGYTPVSAAVDGPIVSLNVPLTVERTISVPLELAVPIAGGSPMHVEGAAVSLPLRLTGTLPLRLDTSKVTTEPSKAFFIAGTPAFRATATTTTDAAGVAVGAKLGFTDVTATLRNLDAALTLTATVRDPDADGKVTRDEFTGMALTDLFTLSRAGTATGTLDIDTSLTRTVTPDFSLTFGGDDAIDLAEGFSFPEIEPVDLLPFRNVTPEQVISGFGQAAAAVAGAQKVGDLPLPFLQGAASDVLSVAQPIFDFVNQQAVVCGTSEQTPPRGIVPEIVPANTKIYCQAFVIHDPTTHQVSNVSWQVGDGIAATFDAPTAQPARNNTVAITPSDHAEFTMTAEGPFNVAATYDLVDPNSTSTVLQAGLRTERPATTAQELVLKLNELGDFMDAEELETAVGDGAKVLDYTTSSKALTFRLRKDLPTVSEELSYDFGDQLEKGSGIIALQGPDGVAADVSIGGGALDVTVGVVLGDLAEIGAGQPCADPTINADSNTDDCPANELDRFFVQVDPDAPELAIDTASVTLEGPAPTLTGRLGFVQIQAAPTQFDLGKKTAGEPVLRLDVTAPSGGLTIGASTIDNAVRLRELLFSLGDFVAAPDVNLKFNGGLAVKALVGNTDPATELGAGTVTIAWPDVTDGVPVVNAAGGFPETLQGFNISPNVFGTHTGGASPTTAPDPDNPSATPDEAILRATAPVFPDGLPVAGVRVDNITDGSFCTITQRVDDRRVRCATGLGGGRVNQWRDGDEFRVQVGDPLAMLWELLDNVDAVVAGIDGLGADGAGAIYETNLPFVGASPKDLVRQINDLKRASAEMRGGPQPTIVCGLNDDDPPTGDPTQLNIPAGGSRGIFCQLQSTKPATDVQWSIVKGGTVITNDENIATVVTPATPEDEKRTVRATITAADSDGGHVRSGEHRDGYAIRATFTDSDGEHIVDFPEQSVPLTLQAFEEMLESKLVLGPEALNIVPQGAGADRRMVLDLNFGVCGYEGSTAPDICTPGARKVDGLAAPLNVDFGNPIGGAAGGLVGVGAQANVQGVYAANARLALSFAVAPDLDPKVEPDTGISVKGRLLADEVDITGNIGPLAIYAGRGATVDEDGAGDLKVAVDFSLRDGDATTAQPIDAYVQDLDATFSVPLGTAQQCGTIDENDPPTPGDPADDTAVSGAACGRLGVGLRIGNSPVEYIGDIGFSIPTLSPDGGFAVEGPHMSAEFADALQNRILSWDALLRALPELLVRLEDGLRASAGSGPDGGKVPLVGDALDAGANVVGVFNSKVMPLVDQIGVEIDAALANCTLVPCENEPPGCDPGTDDPCEVDGRKNPNPEHLEEFVGDFVWKHLGPDGPDGPGGQPGPGLIRKNFAAADPAAREDVIVTARCGLTDCTSLHRMDAIDDVRITFNLGQAAGTSMQNPPAFDIGFDGVPLRVAGAVQATAGWNLLVDLGVSREHGAYLVVAGPTPGYPSAVSRPKELVVDAAVELADDPAICESEVADPPDDAPTVAAVSFQAAENRCLAGKLGFVSVNIRDGADHPVITGDERTRAAIETSLDLQSADAPQATALTKLTLTDLVSGQLRPAVELLVDARANLRFRTGIGALQDAGFPTVVGTFHLDWGFSKASDGTLTEGGVAPDGSVLRPLTIQFRNLHLDISKFFDAYLKPTLDEVRNIVGPFKPVIDTLNAPIPVVSDLAALVGEGPLTLLGLMELISDNNLTVIKSLAAFVSFAVDLAENPDFANGLIALGSGPSTGGAFALTTQGTQRRRLGTSPGPEAADTLIDAGSSIHSAGANLLEKPARPGTTTGGGNTQAATLAANKGLGLTRDNLPGTFGVPGLTFPFMSDASQIFGFVMGKDVTLVRYDVGTLRATAGFSYDFGPFFIGPVPVTAGIGGSATLEGRFALGYDTSGLRKVLSGGSGVFLFDGIFIDDLDSNLADVPEIQLIGDVYARAGVTVFVATAGIEGGIRMTVALNLDDQPEPDGKLRIEEIFNKMSNPICLFDVSGKLEAFLRAFLEIDYFVGSERWDWTILEVTLLDFSKACEPPKPRLATLAGDGTLTLHMGSLPLRNARKISTGEENEKFVVRPAGPEGTGRFSVEAFGVHQVYGPAAPFPGPAITKIVANGGDGKDTILLEYGSDETVAAGDPIEFYVPAEINGGGDADVIKGGARNDRLTGGGGNNKIDGGEGNDVITGGSDNDGLAGEGGHDVILGGGGTDRLSGGPGADYLDGSDGNDIVTGGPGAAPDVEDDTLKDLSDVLIGGTGADSLEGGFGDDILYGEGVSDGGTDLRMFGRTRGIGGRAVSAPLGVFMTASGTHVPSGLMPNSAPKAVATVCDHAYSSGGDDNLDGGAANDVLLGGGAHDTLVGGPAGDTLCGGNGHDELDGDDPSLEASGGGNDDLHGGPDNDGLRGRSGRDVIEGKGGSDVLFGGAGADHLLGGDGNDDLLGAVGNDVLDGGGGTNILVGDSATIAGADRPATDRRAMPPRRADRVALVLNIGTAGDNSVAPSCTYARSASGSAVDTGFADCVTGGSGADVMFGEGGRDRMAGAAGADYLRGGDHDDEMDGDGDVDEMYGDAHADLMRGGAANDTMRGNEGNDAMQGNSGIDTMRGDAGDDRMIGGSLLVGADARDIMDGDGGDDVMAGDNAVIDEAYAVTLLGVTSVDTTTFGNDAMNGGDNDDLMFGQNGDDTMGGDSGRDRVVGNSGDDTLGGGDGDDLLIGGSSAHATLKTGGPASGSVAFGSMRDVGDTASGGDGDDLIFGDNVDSDFDALQPGRPVFAATHPTGTYGDDTLTGDAHHDVLWGQLGGDDIAGSAGHDYLVGDLAYVTGTDRGAPRLTWPGGAPDYGVTLIAPLVGGNDTIGGDAGNDHGYGGAGVDTVAGGLGDDYLEGNAGQDRLYGLSTTHDDGVAQPSDTTELQAIALGGASDQDDMIGGSSSAVWPGASTTVGSDVGETQMHGNADHDVMAGDNADITRVVHPAEPSRWADDLVLQVARRRDVSLRDREKTEQTTPRLSQVSGNDDMFGNAGSDRMYGEGGDDRMKGNVNDDYLEGNQGVDWAEGNDGEDDLIGGSSFTLAGSPHAGDPDRRDYLHGGAGADVITGDNAVVSRTARGAGTPVYFTTKGRFLGFTTPRWIRLLDLAQPVTSRYGDDFVSGGQGEDIAFGQDGADAISGGPNEDYLEGNGGIDRVFGDRLPWDASVTSFFPGVPSGIGAGDGSGFRSASVQLDGPLASDGQDDIVGGSALAGHRDGRGTVTSLPDPSTSFSAADFAARFGDYLFGDGNDDFILGDNGTLTRFSPGYQPVTGAGYLRSIGHGGAAHRIVREAVRHDVGVPAGPWGDDFIEGNSGDDAAWGQDGNDEVWGNAGHDDLHGELGHDRAYGGAGEDAVVGDRGSVTNTWVTDEMRQSGTFEAFTIDTKGPPFLDYQAFTTHRYDRRVDLYRDVEGSVGGRRPGGDRALAGAGVSVGGNDAMRGGPDHDSLHGGAGDDILNGDTGGDYLFGHHGADVLWGGRGSTTVETEDLREPAGTPASTFDDRWVDYLFGGHAGVDTGTNGVVTGGADVLDFRPRSTYSTGRNGTTASDPTSWHENIAPYTSRHSEQQESLRQHHHGVDWVWGGWGRDVLQANLAGQGPNTRDRLIDWAGAYNLYTHCEPDYGGYNDIRAISPQQLDIQERMAFATGAGATLDAVRQTGTSGFHEAAVVYHSDVKHNSGKAYPDTPGHFMTTACTDADSP